MKQNEKLGLLIKVENPVVHVETEDDEIFEIEVRNQVNNHEFWESLTSVMNEKMYLLFDSEAKRLNIEGW